MPDPRCGEALEPQYREGGSMQPELATRLAAATGTKVQQQGLASLTVRRPQPRSSGIARAPAASAPLYREQIIPPAG
jgi:hypothetical protein